MSADHSFSGITFSFSLLMLCMFLRSCPGFQTQAVGVLGLTATWIFLLVKAIGDWDAFQADNPVALAMLGVCVIVEGIRIWRPLDRRRANAEARESFPLASHDQLKAVVSELLEGKALSRFRYSEGKIIFGHGQHGRSCMSDGRWERMPPREANDYLVETRELEARIPQVHSMLSQPSVHELCVNLYFNWSIDSIEMGDGQLTVNLVRRGELKSKHYPYMLPPLCGR